MYQKSVVNRPISGRTVIFAGQETGEIKTVGDEKEKVRSCEGETRKGDFPQE